MIVDKPRISDVWDQCHSIAFLMWLFWYLSQWSGSICSIFCNRLYSEDIHCELGWRTFCCIYSVALSLLFCCLSFACTGQYVTSLYFVPLCKMIPQTYTIDTGPSERIGKWGPVPLIFWQISWPYFNQRMGEGRLCSPYRLVPTNISVPTSLH